MFTYKNTGLFNRLRGINPYPANMENMVSY